MFVLVIKLTFDSSAIGHCKNWILHDYTYNSVFNLQKEHKSNKKRKGEFWLGNCDLERERSLLCSGWFLLAAQAIGFLVPERVENKSREKTSAWQDFLRKSSEESLYTKMKLTSLLSSHSAPRNFCCQIFRLLIHILVNFYTPRRH
jgi:hypothetical protein